MRYNQIALEQPVDAEAAAPQVWENLKARANILISENLAAARDFPALFP
jgi:hypothetical protein